MVQKLVVQAEYAARHLMTESNDFQKILNDFRCNSAQMFKHSAGVSRKLADKFVQESRPTFRHILRIFFFGSRRSPELASVPAIRQGAGYAAPERARLQTLHDPDLGSCRLAILLRKVCQLILQIFTNLESAEGC